MASSRFNYILLVVAFVLGGLWGHFIFPSQPASFPPRTDTETHTKAANSNLTRLFVITPTYDRITKRPELVRIANTLRGMDHILWIVIEDGSHISNYTLEFLQTIDIEFVYLSAPSGCLPNRLEMSSGITECPPKIPRHRGVNQRNVALDYIEDNGLKGVVYFADDDNAYDWRLFEQLGLVKTISFFPVGMIGHMGFHGPLMQYDADGRGRPVGWTDGKGQWASTRSFISDMAGFAFHTELFFAHPARLSWFARGGYLEETFLQNMCGHFLAPPATPGAQQQIMWDKVEILHSDAAHSGVQVWHMHNELSSYKMNRYLPAWKQSDLTFVRHYRQ